MNTCKRSCLMESTHDCASPSAETIFCFFSSKACWTMNFAWKACCCAICLFSIDWVKRGLNCVSVIATSSRIMLKSRARCSRSVLIAAETYFLKTGWRDKGELFYLITFSQKRRGIILRHNRLKSVVNNRGQDFIRKIFANSLCDESNFFRCGAIENTKTDVDHLKIGSSRRWDDFVSLRANVEDERPLKPWNSELTRFNNFRFSSLISYFFLEK